MSVEDNKVLELQQRKERIRFGGGTKAIEKQKAMGKLTARERIIALVDADSFHEYDMFVEHDGRDFGMQDKSLPGDGVIIGTGTILGSPVAIFAQDFTVAGGSLGFMHARKITKIMDYALNMRIPLIGINDSGGARIQEGVNSLSGYTEIFQRNILASGVIPQISAIFGPCAGGAVYSPALTDFILMSQGTSYMFVTGPKVVKTVTGEEVNQEQLGGASVHAAKSGVAHFVVDNEEDGIKTLRKLLSYLPSNNLEEAPMMACNDAIDRLEDTLNEIIPDNPNKPYDVLEVIRAIVDNRDFFECQKLFAQNIVTGFARFNGQSVGIIANQPKYMAGVLDINASRKAARFVRFCDAFNIPIVTLVDVPGFLPGVNQEYGGIIRHGAKMLYAYSEATCPKITVVTRKAYGGAYLAMCSKDLGADMVFAWPTAEIAVMGPDGAANIVYRKEIEASENPQETRKQMIEEYRKNFANPYQAASRGFVDDVIEPALTRVHIASALAMLESKKETRPEKKHGNFPV